MKFGVNILNFGAGTDPHSLRRWATTAESLGYHFVMISDHVAVTDDVNAHYPTPFYEPFTTLAWLAGITEKVEIGTTVAILPYRHPLQTARVVTSLDQLSGGRFIFGVGVGWAKQEFDALGVPFDRRGAMTDEYLSVIKDSFAEEVLSKRGTFVSFADVHTAPTPVRSPHPPIWVGGSSEAALRRAVRYGDAWHPIHSPLAWLRGKGLPRLEQIAEAERKQPPAFCPRIDLQITANRLDDRTRLPGTGTVEQIRADLESLKSLGAEYVLFDSYQGNPEGRRDPGTDLTMFTTLAETVLDLEHRSLR
jgi:probable F420-dependent oxidoreductase